MAENNNKLYLEVFNDGTHDLNIRDAEAQAAIAQIEEEISSLDPATYASVQTCRDIITELI